MKKLTLATVLIASVAGASTIAPPQTMACPVGGKKFTYTGFASYSSWGALPDGQPVGSAEFPIPIPQCPDNGLVVFEEFDRTTVKRLTPLVRSPEYQKLRRSETQRYLVQWLQAKLGAAERDQLWTLLAATWEAKNKEDPIRATRYNEEYVKRALKLPDDPTSLAPLVLKARAANALRELGRFDQAEMIRASLKVLPTMDAADPDSASNREGWTNYLTELAPVIARRDAARAPIDLIGEREARFRCVEPERQGFHGSPLTKFERTYCARPELQQGLEELRKVWSISLPRASS